MDRTKIGNILLDHPALFAASIPILIIIGMTLCTYESFKEDCEKMFVYLKEKIVF